MSQHQLALMFENACKHQSSGVSNFWMRTKNNQFDPGRIMGKLLRHEQIAMKSFQVVETYFI